MIHKYRLEGDLKLIDLNVTEVIYRHLRWEQRKIMKTSECVHVNWKRALLEYKSGVVRFEVFTAVTMKNGVFLDVTP
jgi:hypothetical protein